MEVQGCDGDGLERHKIKDENSKTFTAIQETGRFNQDESLLDFSDFDSAVGLNDLDSIIDFSDLDTINEFNDSFVDSNADSALGCDDFEDELEDENKNSQIKYESEQENEKIIFDHDSFIRENPDEYDKTVNQSNYSTIKLCNKPLCNFQTKVKRDFYNHCLTHEKKRSIAY